MNDDVSIEVTEAAGDWFDLLSQGEVSSEQRKEFVDWISRSPVHIAEFLRVSALYAELSGALSDFPEWAEDLLSHERRAVMPMPGLEGGAKVKSISKGESSTRIQRAGSRFGMAAMLLVAVFIGFLVTQFGDPSRLITAVGEQRIVMLDDGSRLQLNTNSEVRVLFGDDIRELELVRGELLVRVEKDTQRPFIVSTDTAIIQATGTQFNVYRFNSTTEVTVVEGTVLVGWSPDSLSSGSISTDRGLSQELDVGQKMIVAENASAPKSADVDISKATAWTERRLIFESESVAAIADEFNRYNQSQIIVSEPALALRRISGVFDVNDPGAFIALLNSLDVLDVEITQEGNRRLRYKADR